LRTYRMSWPSNIKCAPMVCLRKAWPILAQFETSPNLQDVVAIKRQVRPNGRTDQRFVQLGVDEARFFPGTGLPAHGTTRAVRSDRGDGQGAPNPPRRKSP